MTYNHGKMFITLNRERMLMVSWGKIGTITSLSLQQNITSTASRPQALPKEKKDITSAILSKSNMAK